ncbi:DDHD domain-containing protein [Dipodascopsis uninucleata]
MTIAWFFHNANAPLDDPTAPLPPPSTPAASTIPIEHVTKWHPFAPADNKRLEEAWRAIYLPKEKSLVKNLWGAETSKKDLYKLTPVDTDEENSSVGSTKKKEGHKDKHDKKGNDKKKEGKSDDLESKSISIIVGASRLYSVQFSRPRSKPDKDDPRHLLGQVTAKLVPVYWHPMHDTAHVIRATWFMQGSNDRQFPCPTTPMTDLKIVEGLERAFLSNRPWSSAYKAELESVKKVRPLANKKLSVSISSSSSVIFWPTKVKYDNVEDAIEAERDIRRLEREIIIDYDVGISVANNIICDAALISSIISPLANRMINKSVDRLLRERSPYKSVHVRRGFNWDAWKKAAEYRKMAIPPAQPMQVNHLVLVVHGIGQKLTERVETFDFTYAINTFRVLMAKHHSAHFSHLTAAPPAVLPINWRRNISFEYMNGAPPERHKGSKWHHRSGSEDESTGPPYNLSDITPATISTVRNLISDVLLDIPFYLSKHRPRVIKAVAAEANRIYRLWMRNNPGWSGKVSVVGHSLGSLISVDILSRQPTVPPPLFTQPSNVSESDNIYFEFKVRNLFLVGSPAGFFMLLNSANLIPRIMGENLEEHENDDIGIDHGGVYGCLAAENIYNIAHTSDPIAYRLNPCVDPEYAGRLQTAVLRLPGSKDRPILNRLWDKRPLHLGASDSFKRSTKAARDAARDAGLIFTGNAVRRVKPNFRAGEAIHRERQKLKSRGVYEDERGMLSVSDESDIDEGSTRSSLVSEESARNSASSPRDLAQSEKRMHMLNENGQLDYILQPSGTLDNQYIHILTAHSSYWESKEFAYLVAAECSREMGREHTLDWFRARTK